MSKKVVIADDEAIVRLDLSERLKANGYDVLGEASDGFDAIELCRKFHPDIVLLDIKMPMVDGFSAAKTIGEENLAESIVFLTAYSDSNFVERAKQLGVTGYLVKPIRDDALLPTMEISIARGKELNSLKKDVLEKAKKIEDRKKIEKAKGIVMKSMGMDEKEAYEYMRSVSMKKRISMRRMSEIIMDSSDNMDE